MSAVVTGLLHAAPEKQQRILRLSGLAVIVAVVLVVLIRTFVYPLLVHDESVISVRVETPAVGSGVAPGTDVSMHGAVIGDVESVDLDADGIVTMTLALDKTAVEGLTTDFAIDYRPLNYFGVTAVNIADAGTPGAELVRNNERVWRNASPDYTMTSVIAEASKVANGSLDAQAVEVIRRSLSYSTALQPLIHAGLIVTDTVARTQQALPTATIANLNQFTRSIGPFGATLIGVGNETYNSTLLQGPDWVQENLRLGLEAIAQRFFSMVGDLLGNVNTYLGATLDMVKQAGGILPAIGAGVLTPVTMKRLLTNLDGAFDKNSNGGATLKLRLALDLLPGLQGPVAGPRSSR
ncbi:MlaD family protein [Gordonia terrae]